MPRNETRTNKTIDRARNIFNDVTAVRNASRGATSARNISNTNTILSSSEIDVRSDPNSSNRMLFLARGFKDKLNKIIGKNALEAVATHRNKYNVGRWQTADGGYKFPADDLTAYSSGAITEWHKIKYTLEQYQSNFARSHNDVFQFKCMESGVYQINVSAIVKTYHTSSPTVLDGTNMQYLIGTKYDTIRAAAVVNDTIETPLMGAGQYITTDIIDTVANSGVPVNNYSPVVCITGVVLLALDRQDVMDIRLAIYKCALPYPFEVEVEAALSYALIAEHNEDIIL